LKPLKDENYAGQIILNGDDIQQTLSAEVVEKDVLYTDFRSAEENNPQLISNLLGKIVQAKDGKFAALASALGQYGVFLYVPKHVVIEAPFHSLIWGAPAFSATLSHIFVWLEEGASITFVHESASPTFLESEQAFHSGVVELHVGKGAKLNFIELQSWGEHVWSFSHERARVSHDGTLDWVFGAIGTRLSKNFSDIDLLEPGARARMTGFYFCDGHQHLDHDTQQNHLAPHTTSDLLFKGALFGSSRSVWQGMIYVAPKAVKTDGYQSNKNLILSKKARADSIPGLEILADDVRCSHGATVSRIDENALFYIQSRGIPKREAEKLIVKGFFSEILDRIPMNLIRERFEQAIDRKMVNRES
ncbi:MAG: Fe-S cluster assembly protein SufD, partial [Chloroflexota bacterium]